jgi:hypothetical protein
MGQLHTLTSALDGGECSASRPGRFTPGTYWMPVWTLEPVWTRWQIGKKKNLFLATAVN